MTTDRQQSFILFTVVCFKSDALGMATSANGKNLWSVSTKYARIWNQQVGPNVNRKAGCHNQRRHRAGYIIYRKTDGCIAETEINGDLKSVRIYLSIDRKGEEFRKKKNGSWSLSKRFGPKWRDTYCLQCK